MYMFVLVTLIVAVIGIYTQVFNVQQAHMNAQQNGIAQAMLDWHAAAVGLAENAVTPSYVASGCSLTQNYKTTNYCHNSTTGNTYLPLSNTTGYLPPGYATGSYAFYSFAYQAGTPLQSFVLTFVQMPTGNPAFVCLPNIAAPGCTQIDIVMNDLLNQIRRKGVTTSAYGTVSGGFLVTPTTTIPSGPTSTVLGTVSYPLPAGLTLPSGSIGVISQISLCSSC